MAPRTTLAWCLASLILLALLILAPVGEARASLQVEASVEVDHISVEVVLANVSTGLYERMLEAKPFFNETTIPEAILAYLRGEGLKKVYYRGPELSFDNETRTVVATFTLAGRGLVRFSYNRTTMARLYEVRAGWRKTDIEVRGKGELLFKLNFSSYFSQPLEKWEHVKYEVKPGDRREALFLNSTVQDGLDPLWYFILPKGSKLIEASGDTFVFGFPPTFWDKFLASPFWPFLAVLLAISIAASYRKAAIRLVRPTGG